MRRLVEYKVHGRVPYLQSIRLARGIRAALTKLSDGARVFVGRDDNHDHASYLPIWSSQVEHVERFVLDLPATASKHALAAAVRLGHIDFEQLRCVLVLIDVYEPQRIGPCIWVSAFPFFCTTYPKWTNRGAPKLDRTGRQRGGVEYDVVRLLQLRGVEARDVSAKPWHLPFDLAGLKGRRGPVGPVKLKLLIESEQYAPLSIGYGAHYGLGRLVPKGSSCAL